MESIAKVKDWLQEGLGAKGILLSRRKSQALLADRVGTEYLVKEQRTAMDDAGLTVV